MIVTYSNINEYRAASTVQDNAIYTYDIQL